MTKQGDPRIKYLFGIINMDVKSYYRLSIYAISTFVVLTILSYTLLRDSSNIILKYLWLFSLFCLIGTTLEMFYFLFKQKKELEVQLKKQIKEITDSINYAKLIQQAILPFDNEFNQHFTNSFILFKPKDVVSGDFYWIHQSKDEVIWTVADCTGHGVPGAFMSMIGSSLLNELIIEKGITSANNILDELKKLIIKALGQTGKTGETKDGMDAALCVWNKKTNILEYAGAHNPLFIIRKNIASSSLSSNNRIKFFGADLAEIKADKQPIGYWDEKDEPFTKHIVQLQTGDTLYLFSDGYSDQFGGIKNKKFTNKRFKNLLLSFQEKSMEEQKQILDKTIKIWKGDEEQVDDICIIGVRI